VAFGRRRRRRTGGGGADGCPRRVDGIRARMDLREKKPLLEGGGPTIHRGGHGGVAGEAGPVHAGAAAHRRRIVATATDFSFRGEHAANRRVQKKRAVDGRRVLLDTARKQPAVPQGWCGVWARWGAGWVGSWRARCRRTRWGARSTTRPSCCSPSPTPRTHRRPGIPRMGLAGVSGHWNLKKLQEKGGTPKTPRSKMGKRSPPPCSQIWGERRSSKVQFGQKQPKIVQ